MSEDTPYTALITFVDGSQRKFEFLPIGDQDPTHYFRRLREIHEAGELVLELEDRVISLVHSSIASVEITPKPKRIPRNAIQVYREITD